LGGAFDCVLNHTNKIYTPAHEYKPSTGGLMSLIKTVDVTMHREGFYVYVLVDVYDGEIIDYEHLEDSYEKRHHFSEVPNMNLINHADEDTQRRIKAGLRDGDIVGFTYKRDCRPRNIARS
jgi:hypothetical protein